MELITKAAHKKVSYGWDLSHSIGSVPHNFKKIDPDFAIWCTYKHISVTGSNAILYQLKHFGTEPDWQAGMETKRDTIPTLPCTPEADADAWLTGTPNILSMAPLEGIMRLFNEAGIENIRKKSFAYRLSHILN